MSSYHTQTPLISVDETAEILRAGRSFRINRSDVERWAEKGSTSDLTTAVYEAAKRGASEGTAEAVRSSLRLLLDAFDARQAASRQRTAAIPHTEERCWYCKGPRSWDPKLGDFACFTCDR